MGVGQIGVEDGKKRCSGNRPGQDLLADYHDTEWGVSMHDGRLLFEMVTLEALRDKPGIIRSRLKIYSTRSNARDVLAIQHEFGSFSDHIWFYVDGRPVINDFAISGDVPAFTPLSEQISGDLKKHGFCFVARQSPAHSCRVSVLSMITSVGAGAVGSHR
jgi:DNA-3-methyladenine glycosylase I